MYHRSMSLLVTGLYIFMPMLFLEPSEIFTTELEANVVRVPYSNVQESILGQGGPAEGGIPKRNPIDNTVVYEDDDMYDFSEIIDIDEPKSTVTKKYNHLKVSNTSMPVDSAEISSGYGYRNAPCESCSSDHQGIDFVPGAGEPVYAIADGMITDIGNGGGYGNYIVINHLMGNPEGMIEEWTSIYAHLQNNDFAEDLIIGSVVKSGEQVGRVGNTGISTGPHLHFELIVDGDNVDPMPLLGTYEILIISEEEYPDYLFVGETIKVVEKTINYE